MSVFFHSWHYVFHQTHTSHPTPSPIQIANQALRSAYARWDVINPDRPLSSVYVIFKDQYLMATQGTANNSDSPMDNVPDAPLDIANFEVAFKNVVSSVLMN